MDERHNVQFWCPWCGETATGSSPDDDIPCVRCQIEFAGLFGFVPRTSMSPLEPGHEPGEPIAEHKRFVFFDTRNGREIGRTDAPRRVRRAG